jgi:hypothetical protein
MKKVGKRSCPAWDREVLITRRAEFHGLARG